MIAAILNLLLCAFAMRGQAKPTPKLQFEANKIPLTQEMHETADLVIELQKYSTSVDKFGDPKNEKDISRILAALQKKSLNILKHSETSTTAYRLSGEALAKHFSELNKVYHDGSRIYARWMSISTPMICASCHSQLPEAATHVWKLKEKDLNGSAIDRADLLFSTWNYDDALKIYDELIRNFPSKFSSDNFELERAINKKLVTYLRVKRDPIAARTSFEVDLKNKKLPEGISERLQHWVSSIKSLERIQKDNKNFEKPENLLSFANKTYFDRNESDQNAPTRVYASGLLYEALHRHPQDQYSPEFLYWLGTSDQGYNGNFHFGLSQSYLRECIVKYSLHPIAKKCFEDYALEERAQWTGTRGYYPPPGLEKELRHLEMKLKKAKAP